MSNGSLFNDDDWREVAKVEVEEDDCHYRPASIYVHKQNGGHCLYFGGEECEGLGARGARGTCVYSDGALRDADGDVVNIHSVTVVDYSDEESNDKESNDDDDHSDDDSDDDYVPTDDGRRGQGRAVLPAGQCECPTCHLRSDSSVAVDERHDRHFPWCDNYVLGTSWTAVVFIDVAREEMQCETVATLKRRLLLCGATTSGKKEVLVGRLVAAMETPAPHLGLGSWCHFQKRKTTAALEKFCTENHMLIKSGASKMDLYDPPFAFISTSSIGSSRITSIIIIK